MQNFHELPCEKMNLMVKKGPQCLLICYEQPQVMYKSALVFILILSGFSIAFHFRYTESEKMDVKTKTSILNKIGRRLNYLAHKYNLVIVVTNQMTTKIEQKGSNG